MRNVVTGGYRSDSDEDAEASGKRLSGAQRFLYLSDMRAFSEPDIFPIRDRSWQDRKKFFREKENK